MITTIQKLEEAKTFVLEQWKGVSRDENGKQNGGYKDGEYTFDHHGFKDVLYVSGDVLGETEYSVKNVFEVLYDIAAGHDVTLKLKSGTISIRNPILRIE